jgi:Fe2+ or Zn2+ uptake regulation protein
MTAAHDLSTTLRSRGQRVTPQRLVILDALRELDRHITADEIHAAVSERLPNVSAPTVYATLELFEELGLVRRINLAGGAALYDPRPDDHHHLVCTQCGRVEDLDSGVDLGATIRAASRRGFRPDRAEVVVHGRCARCAR